MGFTIAQKKEGVTAIYVTNVLFGESAAAGLLAGSENDGVSATLDLCTKAAVNCEGPVVFSKSSSPGEPYLARSAGFMGEQAVETPRFDAVPGPWYAIKNTVVIDTSHLRPGSFKHTRNDGSNDELFLNEQRIAGFSLGALSPWGVVNSLEKIIASAGDIGKFIKKHKSKNL